MKFHRPFITNSVVHKSVVGVIAGLTALSGTWGGLAHAEPAYDNVANLNDLSEQSEELSASIRTARTDLDEKLRALSFADTKHAKDLAALDAAKAQLGSYQGAVNNLAAAVYMGGGTHDLTAILTAASPKSLIDDMSMQRVMNTEMSQQLRNLRQVKQEAQVIEAASAKSAADLQAAVAEATAVRADLQRKQAELQSRITEAKARYAVLPPAEQAALAPSAAVVAALGLANPVPTVGMSGLVSNARSLAAYVIAAYPGVQSIGGVRSDPLPDHPSGHAIDIMIGSNMGLGDAINADVQSQSGRFGVVYTMWRVASHFDHVHITVS